MMLNKTFYLILLSLIPLLGFSQANSQYPDSGNKIRLGFQTSGDGLIWRDTQPKVAGYQPINNKAAWIVLDTVNNKFYHYKRSNNTWNLAGGQDIDTANLIATKYNLGFKLSLADTGNMLTPYWRSGRFSGTLPVANGGTNASTFTAGSVVFAGTSGTYTQDNTNLFWDNTNKRLGIGVLNPTATIDVAAPKVQFRLTSTTGTNSGYGLFANNATNFYFGIDGNTGQDFDQTNINSAVLWNGGATPMLFATSNIRRMIITSTGDVGIGTGTPNARLHVKGSGVTSVTSALKVDNNGNTNLLNILDNGNVGIGDNGPSSKLQVAGDVRISGTGIAIDGYDGGFFDYASSALRIRGQNSTGGAIAFMTSANGVNNVSTERMRITSGGNVGIGTASPDYKLDVAGTGRFTNAVNVFGVNLAHAANKTVLSQEGSSNGAYWQSYGTNETTVGKFTLRQYSSDGSVSVIPLSIETTGAATFSSSVTANSLSLTTPLSVANGGTGQSTLAANKVMVGNGTTGVLTPTNLHWDNTNSKLGIGLTPIWTLDVSSTQEVPAYFTSNATATIIGINNSNASAGNPQFKFFLKDVGKFSFGVDNSDSDKFKIGTTGLSTNTRLTIDASGNVGIGTTSPTARLHVKGSGVEGNTSALKIDNDGNTNLLNILDNGAATFSSSVTAGGDILANGSSIFTKAASGGYQISLNAQDSPMKLRFDNLTGAAYGAISFQAGNGTGGFVDRLTIASTGAATFSSSVTANSLSLTTPLSVANGGTGQTTPTAALNALLPTQSQSTTIGATLKSNGTNSYWDNFKDAGVVQDQSGNFYNTVTIGTQVWFKENLRTKKYRSGILIPVKTNTDTSTLVGQMYYYNNDSLTNYPIYGALYNWQATKGDSLCPVGWHVPTDAEWTTLTNFLSSNQGGKLKGTGTTYWNSPNTLATNETGFSALPSGYRNSGGNFSEIRNYTFFWSATQIDSDKAYTRALEYNNGILNRNDYSFFKSVGLSVRCLRNTPANNLSSDFTGTLPVENGGTGNTSLDAAGIVTKTGTQTISGAKTYTDVINSEFSSGTVNSNAFPRIGAINTNANKVNYNLSELFVSAGNGAVSGGLVASYSIDFPTTEEKSITLRNRANGPLYFQTNDNTRLTIDSTGKVGIGTTSPSTKLDIYDTSGSGGEVINVLKITEFNTSVASNNGSAMLFQTRSNSGVIPMGRISALLTDGSSSPNEKGDMLFYTKTAGTANPTEKMRITSDGNVNIGTSISTGILTNGSTSIGNINAKSFLLGTTGTEVNYRWQTYLVSDNYTVYGRGYGDALSISYATGAVKIFNLATGTVTSSSGTLSATSDMNLKISDGYIDNALDKIMNLKPRYFYWKEETGLPTNIRQLGFYAQEVNQSLGEEAANTPKNENDKWGIYDRSIIAMLTKAMQEQQSQIDILKQEIINLKNK